MTRYLRSAPGVSNALPAVVSTFIVPSPWKFLILESVQRGSTPYAIFLYTKSYFFNLTLLSNLQHFNYDPQTRQLAFSHLVSPYTYRMFTELIFSTMSRFDRPFFQKIKFQGKGYYVYKTGRNTIAPQFGYAHRIYVYAQAVSVKFLSKTKIMVFGLSKLDVIAISNSVKAVKPINIFTGRGVRFARQVVYRKTGKVSSYR